MSDGISIDVGKALLQFLPFLIDRIQILRGKDAATEAARRELSRHTQTVLDHASQVQCVGMYAPISIAKIFQPSRFSTLESTATATIDIDTLLHGRHAIVYAKPGCGKTTLLKWLFC